MRPACRELRWIASSLKDLAALPPEVKRVMGYALWLAQEGAKHPSDKPLKGFRGGSVLEVVEEHDGDAYRAIYTVRFEDAVYLLHAFQKKSKRGAKTDRADIEIVKSRLKVAETDHEARRQEKDRWREK